MAASVEARIAVGEGVGDVSGLLLRPDGARLLYVLAHGAGAGMRHPFLAAVPGRPDDKRAEHLARIEIPMLFLQGTRDEFADLKLLQPLVERLGARATLHLVEGGDHSFHVLKRSGRTDADVMGELVQAMVDFT